MQEIPDSGTSLTNRCSDTTGESTLNTSAGRARATVSKGRQTRLKRQGSDMSGSKEKSKEPPPRILANELSRWTFKSGEKSYPADDTSLVGMFAWQALVNEWADVKVSIDWEDLETRAHFLNMLFVWCEEHNKPFPLAETKEVLSE